MKLPLSLRLVSPLGMLIVAIVLWLACFAMPFNEYTKEQNPEAYLLLAGYLVAFIAGTLVWRRKALPGVPGVRTGSVEALRIAFTVLLLISVVGIALRYVDLLFVKHFQDYDTASAFRLAEVEEGPQETGPLSAISTLLYPISMVTFLLGLYLHRRLHTWQRVLATLLIFPFAGYTVLQGGRAVLAVTGIMTLVVLILRGVHDPEKRMEGPRLKALILCCIVGLCGFIGYSAYVVTSRASAMGVDDPTALLDVAQETRGFKLRDPYYMMAKMGSPATSAAVMTGSSLTYYMNHGFFNFSELYDSERGKTPLGGVMQFGPVYRYLDNLGLDVPSTDQAEERIPHPGLFYTFFGNVLLDYGAVGGILYCLLLGMFVQALWLKARQGSLLALVLYPFFASVIVQFPLSDMIVGAYGLFTIFAIVFSVALIHFFSAVVKPHARRRVVPQTA